MVAQEKTLKKSGIFIIILTFISLVLSNISPIYAAGSTTQPEIKNTKEEKKSTNSFYSSLVNYKNAVVNTVEGVPSWLKEHKGVAIAGGAAAVGLIGGAVYQYYHRPHNIESDDLHRDLPQGPARQTPWRDRTKAPGLGQELRNRVKPGLFGFGKGGASDTAATATTAMLLPPARTRLEARERQEAAASLQAGSAMADTRIRVVINPRVAGAIEQILTVVENNDSKEQMVPTSGRSIDDSKEPMVPTSGRSIVDSKEPMVPTSGRSIVTAGLGRDTHNPLIQEPPGGAAANTRAMREAEPVRFHPDLEEDVQNADRVLANTPDAVAPVPAAYHPDEQAPGPNAAGAAAVAAEEMVPPVAMMGDVHAPAGLLAAGDAPFVPAVRVATGNPRVIIVDLRGVRINDQEAILIADAILRTHNRQIRIIYTPDLISENALRVLKIAAGDKLVAAESASFAGGSNAAATGHMESNGQDVGTGAHLSPSEAQEDHPNGHILRLRQTILDGADEVRLQNPPLPLIQQFFDAPLNVEEAIVFAAALLQRRHDFHVCGVIIRLKNFPEITGLIVNILRCGLGETEEISLTEKKLDGDVICLYPTMSF
jgi:hypothetical protein